MQGQKTNLVANYALPAAIRVVQLKILVHVCVCVCLCVNATEAILNIDFRTFGVHMSRVSNSRLTCHFHFSPSNTMADKQHILVMAKRFGLALTASVLRYVQEPAGRSKVPVEAFDEPADGKWAGHGGIRACDGIPRYTVVGTVPVRAMTSIAAAAKLHDVLIVPAEIGNIGAGVYVVDRRATAPLRCRINLAKEYHAMANVAYVPCPFNNTLLAVTINGIPKGEELFLTMPTLARDKCVTQNELRDFAKGKSIYQDDAFFRRVVGIVKPGAVAAAEEEEEEEEESESETEDMAAAAAAPKREREEAAAPADPRPTKRARVETTDVMGTLTSAGVPEDIASRIVHGLGASNMRLVSYLPQCPDKWAAIPFLPQQAILAAIHQNTA